MKIKDGKQTQNRHGTRCAGEIAAVRNNVCGVGVAFNSKVSGIRLLDGPMTDSLEATAFNKFMYINDIYSCSWGPDDDGKTVDGPHTLAKAALQHGVTYGRRGRGSIFVVASGNGGKNGDNCNYDGYANSMYTVTIGAVDEKGQMPFYAEECASLFAVTFSSGSRPQRNIVTTDWTLGPGTGCTNTHTGTSAAAPLAAGMISLMLEAKPCLSWRDVQHIIVYSASKIDEKKGEWTVNAAGFHHSHKHGFGVLKAWRLVNAAKVWPSVPWLTSVVSPTLKVHRVIPTVQAGSQLTVQYEVTNATALENELSTLEHVLITVSLSHTMRGKLKIELICPSGTRSVIGARRKKDNSRDGLHGWTFSTVRCWGEDPVGDWQLIITDFSTVGGGVLEEWTLALYGSNMKPADVAERKIMVAESYGGEFLDTNLTEPCSFYWATPIEEESFLSMKTIKFLLLISAFATVLALYYSFEQAFCTDDEKRKHATEMGLDKPSGDRCGENEELLDDQNIPMDDLTCDLTSVDLQEVTSDPGQGAGESDMYACRVPVVCLEVGGDDGSADIGRSEVIGRSGVDGEGFVTNVQSRVSSDSRHLTHPAGNGCISVQPAGDHRQRTGVDSLPCVRHHAGMELSNSVRRSAATRTVSPEIQAAASQLARLDGGSVNRPIASCDTDRQPLVLTTPMKPLPPLVNATEGSFHQPIAFSDIDSEPLVLTTGMKQTTSLVGAVEGSSIQPTILPETLHSNCDLESSSTAPSVLPDDSRNSIQFQTRSCDKFVDVPSEVPLVLSANSHEDQTVTKDTLSQCAIVLENKPQGHPLEWETGVLSKSSEEDWTTPTFDAFQSVSMDTPSSESADKEMGIAKVELRSQTPPFLSR
ncbi:proprotein convertase subtilisin/kexin type 7-like [Lytechinus pictus]|uniref:proprotein convertase subtilisin/kexin type 7-like n=1 Tax=Lytechinus pictus TaxID=7653 RepID=UPI0030BA1B87